MDRRLIFSLYSSCWSAMYFYESSWNKFTSNTKYREQKDGNTRHKSFIMSAKWFKLKDCINFVCYTATVLCTLTLQHCCANPLINSMN